MRGRVRRFSRGVTLCHADSQDLDHIDCLSVCLTGGSGNAADLPTIPACYDNLYELRGRADGVSLPPRSRDKLTRFLCRFRHLTPAPISPTFYYWRFTGFHKSTDGWTLTDTVCDKTKDKVGLEIYLTNEITLKHSLSHWFNTSGSSPTSIWLW